MIKMVFLQKLPVHVTFDYLMQAIMWPVKIDVGGDRKQVIILIMAYYTGQIWEHCSIVLMCKIKAQQIWS